jgi:hypothetical protein
MDFNWGGGNTPQSGQLFYSFFAQAGTGLHGGLTSFSAGSFVNVALDSFGMGNTVYNHNPPSFYNASAHQYESPGNNVIFDFISDGFYAIKNTGSSTHTWESQILHQTTVLYSSGTQSLAAGASTGVTFPAQAITTQAGDVIKFQIKVSNTDIETDLCSTFACLMGYFPLKVTNSNFVSQSLMSNIRGETEQYSFFKAIINMFNLVVIADKSDPKNNSTMILKPLADLKKYNEFKYEFDEEDAHLKLFKKTASIEYGENTPNLGSDFDILEGENKIEISGFGATYIEPLIAGYDNDFVVPHIVARNDDGTYESFDNNARILYDNGVVTMSTGSYFVPAFGDDGAETNTNFLQFSHLSDIPVTNTTDDYNFGLHQLSTPLVPTVNNLYNLYWGRYFDELYNINTRIIELKIKLTPSDIASFEFYDTVIIKNKEYRVNKIDYKAGQLAKVELILIP